MGTAKFTFQPMRIFQHLEGRFLGTAGRGCELGWKALVLVHRSHEDVLFDHFLYNLYLAEHKFIVQIKVNK
jgi:hypothetical protein